MTIQEIHQAIDVELDKSMDLEYPYIQPEIKDYWLNKAQIELVNLYAYPPVPQLKGFEHGERRIDELREITVTSPSLTPIKVGSVYEINLPNDYFHLVRHRCTVTSLSGNKTLEVGGIQTQQDTLNVWNKNPFWEPIFEEPLFYILGDKIFYETKDNFTVNSSKLTYLKFPAKMQFGSTYSNPTVDIQCEFTTEDMQHKIIDKAVTMLLENIESQRYSTKLNEFNNNN